MRIADRYRVTRADLMQFVKYMIGGTSCFWTGYIVFALYYVCFLWVWFLSTTAVTFISAGFFIIWNYIWYQFWVFYTENRVAKAKEANV